MDFESALLQERLLSGHEPKAGSSIEGRVSAVLNARGQDRVLSPHMPGLGRHHRPGRVLGTCRNRGRQVKSEKNQFGLDRNIPAAIKREIRQKCGFGCVICCSSIWEYEHIDPPFAQATRHDPNAMALLCPGCHKKVTSRLMSKDTVQRKRRDPCTSRTGYARDFFDIGETMPSLTFAGVQVQNCSVPIMVNNEALFEVKEGEEPGAPFRLSGNFYNSNGELSLQIVDNEWRVMTEANWDVDVVGPKITIRESPNHVSLRLIADPPHGLIVDRMNMQVGNYRFIGNRNTLVMQDRSGNRTTLTGQIKSHCHVGYQIDDNPEDTWLLGPGS